MPLENIVRLLDKAQKVGSQYKACCPVHGDRNPSMYLKEEDGKVLAHCFSCGANGMDVVEALGLSVNELFSDKMTPADAKYRKLKSYDLEDKLIISIFESDEAKGKTFTVEDYRRYRLAIRRQEILYEQGA